MIESGRRVRHSAARRGQDRADAGRADRGAAFVPPDQAALEAMLAESAEA